ncbi:MAG: asparagine synthase (glutamine-hydrolyzing) [Acidobacteria bacterium]|nr:asparagine synthase (glutamine-hydrolyzing) [Acidobacteriota bacterium]
MCGIAGIVSRHNIKIEEICSRVTAATRALAHRGPDDEGVEIVAADIDGWNVVFGHRRLSIIDLSAAGHQPMRDPSTGDWITYNGEVFNFREVRARMPETAFHSESDTEVLLAGLARSGVEAVREWRGMFALGWWDASARSLTLIRDRLGIKPLYYYFDGDTFIFASEVRALLATGLVPHRLSRAAIESYLAYGSVQQPLSIVEGVYSVLPGHALEFTAGSKGRIKQHPYWELRALPARDAQPTVDEISALTAEAVKLRLVSDVPVGVFLSGGVDSSAVVALLGRAEAGEIDSFSVCFREEEFSERRYAELIARHYRTRHSTVLLTEGDVLAKLPFALAAMDQPSVDGINSYVVSEAAAQAGLKVAISGLGGDEVFAGYHFFRTAARDERRRRAAQRIPRQLRRAAALAVSGISSGNRATKLQGLLRSEDLGEPVVRLHRRLFTGEQCERLLAPAETDGDSVSGRDLLDAWTARQLANCAEADPVNRASALDLGGYMSNTLLRDTDSMSMAHSLEVRVPLIDHLLVERMLQMEGGKKVRAGEPKWLLAAAAGDLPREIIDRPKRGFELPFRHWLRGALRENIERAFNNPYLDDMFRPGAFRLIWEDFLAGRVSWSRVWSLYVLDEWTRRHLQNR